MCYEIHGDEDKWFNFISDKCLSLNAYYKRGKVFNRIGHVIRELGILAEDDNRQCRQVLAVMNDDGDCSVMVDGSEVNVSNSGGLRVNKNRNRIRVSVPNCDNHRVVIWASCEDFFGNQIMRLVVTRGLNLRPTSHGFLGRIFHRHTHAQHTHTHTHTNTHTHNAHTQHICTHTQHTQHIHMYTHARTLAHTQHMYCAHTHTHTHAEVGVST